MKKNKLLIICNPKAGRRKSKRSLSDIIRFFEENGYDVSVSITRARCHATKIAEKKGGKYELLVCCGGDGTLNEVLSGVVKVKNPPVIGYIPSGSTNDFAAGLKLPKNTLVAAKKIVSGRPSPIDLGSFNGRTFAYIASFGAFTGVAYKTPQEIKNLWGHLAYLFEGIKDIKNIKPYHIKADLDGKEFEDDYAFGSITNAMSIGGILKLDPKVAKLNDGLFEVMLVKMPQNIMELHRIINCFIRRHFDDSLITFVQASKIKIEAPEDMDWTLDGEYEKGTKEISIENINEAVRIII